MLSLLQGKQNLWCCTEGHWTKCVSSNLSWHRVHFNVVVVGAVAATFSDPAGRVSLTGAPNVPAPASEEVTVVEETCLEPDDLLLLEDPAAMQKKYV